jgi:hypothetical protein
MTIEQRGVVDIISIDEGRKIANLIITDHLGWENLSQHCSLVQDKLNEYLEFIEEGGLFEARPDIVDARLVLKLVYLHQPPAAALEFYRALQKALAEQGYAFVFEKGSM